MVKDYYPQPIEELFGVTIRDNDFVVGRQQLASRYVPSFEQDLMNLGGYGITILEAEYREIHKQWNSLANDQSAVAKTATWILERYNQGAIRIALKDT